jgi:HlyD family secretion protein
VNAVSSDLQLNLTPDTDDPKHDIRIGTIVAFVFFIVLLGWAAFIPLDAAVRAPGNISVLGNRQSVQHPEGGVVTAIHVTEGQRVRAGQLLVELAAPDAKAAERAVTSDYFALLAQKARINAERSGLPLQTPPEFLGLPAADRAIAQEAMRLQGAQMLARASSMSAQQSVLVQRERQLRQQQSGFNEQRQSYAEQRQLLDDELDGLREIQKKGFASMNRVRELERVDAELRGRQAALASEIARSGEAVGETRMQSLSLTRSMQEQLAEELRDTESRISTALPKLISLREQLQRAQIRAPATGAVVGLTTFTVGGVVAAGQTLMDIVPENRKLVIQAIVSPIDADDVYSGQPAQVRFASVGSRNLPLVTGHVKTISADSFQDEKNSREYFRAEIEVGEGDLERVQSVLGKGQLRAGLPVECMLLVRKRTALEYLLEPLGRTLTRSLHEQ